MIHFFYVLVSIAFFIWATRNVLFWVMLWQIKEYRFDRLSVHLKETFQGKQILFSPLLLIKWVIVFLYGFFVFYSSYFFLYDFCIGLLFFYEVKKVLSEKLRLRPTRTIKSFAIVALSMFVIIVFYLLPLTTDLFLWLLLVSLFIPVIVVFFVRLFSFPTEIFRDIIIQRAIKSLKGKKLLIIAVSGSYGKSSTKEYIAQVLAKKFNVIKTPLSNNTPIGIANTIISQIKKETDVFVVEMGAYKKGEIRELCQIVKPTISVTTSVSDQHISLYGSLQNAIDTEEELIEALPKNGLALFNGNNNNSYGLYKDTRKKKILYSTTKVDEYIPDIYAYNIKSKKNGISFDIFCKDVSIHLETSLLGVHNIENILPAIFLAIHLGIEKKLIIEAIAHLSPPPKTMTKKIASNNATVIDDTFNASPESVLAAIEYMKLYNRKKIFVLTPLVELGKNSKIHHYHIGLALSTSCQYLFLTNKNFYKEIMSGIKDGKGKCVVKVAKPEELAREILALTQAGDIIIFEGKEAGKVLYKCL